MIRKGLMKRDIDVMLAYLALIGLTFLLPLYAVHSLAVAAAVSCVTGLAAWSRMQPVSLGERRRGRGKVEIVAAEPSTPADDKVQGLTSPAEEVAGAGLTAAEAAR
jgi:hypothetical protein